jgi:hypothetical protein
MGSPEIDLIYVHTKNDHMYTFETRKIRDQLEDIPLNSLHGIRTIKKYLQKIPE